MTAQQARERRQYHDRQARRRHQYPPERKPPASPASGGPEPTRRRRRDASTFTAEISLSAIDTDEGILVVAAIRDVTAQLRMKDLEVSNRGLEGFIYTVSHDLRAPLRSLSGYSELCLRSTEGFSARKAVAMPNGSSPSVSTWGS